ncbi:hypothetical protein Vafri_5260 [Volvox africanus]|uniref:Uncharacterized protein n=1 Tax=Volvox africanus TaxID=51714 RepID=A0A8J4AW19_9CHLO|nr:hypothetical protein Vafri_5260 [Volvox africanus]
MCLPQWQILQLGNSLRLRHVPHRPWLLAFPSTLTPSHLPQQQLRDVGEPRPQLPHARSQHRVKLQGGQWLQRLGPGQVQGVDCLGGRRRGVSLRLRKAVRKREGDRQDRLSFLTFIFYQV